MCPLGVPARFFACRSPAAAAPAGPPTPLSRATGAVRSLWGLLRTVASLCWVGMETLAGWRRVSYTLGGVNLHRHMLLTQHSARLLCVVGAAGQSVDAIVLSPPPPDTGVPAGPGGAGTEGADEAAAAASARGAPAPWEPRCLLMPDGKPRPTVLLCSPNAGMYEQAGAQSDWLELYLRLGLNVCMYNYRWGGLPWSWSWSWSWWVRAG